MLREDSGREAESVGIIQRVRGAARSRVEVLVVEMLRSGWI